MKYTIRQERFAKIMEELHWLFVRHHGEVSLDCGNLEADVDYGRYCGLENLGVLHCLIARDDESGRIVGYLFNMVVPHLHHKGLITSAADMLYVVPEHRKGTGVGLALIKTGIDEMKKLGVRKIYMGCEVGSPLKKILPRLGFKHFEENYSMAVGE